MSTNSERIAAAREAGAWAFNNDYKDLAQVAEFYPAYSAVVGEILDAGRYPYNADFKGRIPGIEGPCEDTAIYLLQRTRHLLDHEAKVAEYRAAGYRDFDRSELGDEPARFASIVEHGYENGETGIHKWDNARLAWFQPGNRNTIVVLPARARTRGYLIYGKLLVKD